jgi:hypothetical protein
MGLAGQEEEWNLMNLLKSEALVTEKGSGNEWKSDNEGLAMNPNRRTLKK